MESVRNRPASSKAESRDPESLFFIGIDNPVVLDQPVQAGVLESGEGSQRQVAMQSLAPPDSRFLSRPPTVEVCQRGDSFVQVVFGLVGPSRQCPDIKVDAQ